MKTYNEVYLAARKRLRLAGIETSDAEARLIVTTASGKSVEQFMRDRNLYVPGDAYENTVKDLLDRRIAGEPIAYILGEWEFYGIPVTVSRDVLIPRVDTEVLADAVISELRNNLQGKRILDLCAGTGCVGLAVAANVPFTRVVLADTSPEALRLCRANTIRNKLTRSVTSVELDALREPPMLLGVFDFIVSNPPYIPTDEIETLDVSVRDFEPHGALDGGPDGLDFFRSIASKWKSVLKENGRVAFECGAGQAEAVRGILADSGYADIRTVRDTLDIERVVIASKRK
jgi:release factor glutamine methyltransferase